MKRSRKPLPPWSEPESTETENYRQALLEIEREIKRVKAKFKPGQRFSHKLKQLNLHRARIRTYFKGWRHKVPDASDSFSLREAHRLLTPREYQIFRLHRQGTGLGTIARELQITKGATQTFLKRARAKLYWHRFLE